jgi:hypothetical protein
LAARWLFSGLFVFLAYHAVVGEPARGVALALGVLPAVMMLRDLVLYNAVVLVLALSTVAVALRYPAARLLVFRPRFIVLGVIATAFWLLAYLLTGDYFVNLRGLELAFSVAAVGVLSHRPSLVPTALRTLLLTVTAIGVALLGFGDRLGAAVVGDVALGNPVAFGIPLTLLLFAVAADGGRWIGLHDRPMVRTVGLAVIGVFLLLSASRASWLAGAVGLLMILVLNRRHRGVFRFGIPLLIVATLVLLRTDRGEDVRAWFERSFGSERTLTQRTSGRWDQWTLFPTVMGEAPLWGFGPGSGPDIYADYSLRDSRISFRSGNDMQWHSLYQHVAVETGVIGLTVVLLLLGTTVHSAYRYWQRRRLLLPLLGMIGFVLIAATVTGMDAASGLLLGFGFLAEARAVPGPNNPGSLEATLVG